MGLDLSALTNPLKHVQVTKVLAFSGRYVWRLQESLVGLGGLKHSTLAPVPTFTVISYQSNNAISPLGSFDNE